MAAPVPEQLAFAFDGDAARERISWGRMRSRARTACGTTNAPRKTYAPSGSFGDMNRSTQRKPSSTTSASTVPTTASP